MSEISQVSLLDEELPAINNCRESVRLSEELGTQLCNQYHVIRPVYIHTWKTEELKQVLFIIISLQVHVTSKAKEETAMIL